MINQDVHVGLKVQKVQRFISVRPIIMGYTALNYEVQRKENETTITIHVNNEAYNQSQKGSLQRYQIVSGQRVLAMRR